MLAPMPALAGAGRVCDASKFAPLVNGGGPWFTYVNATPVYQGPLPAGTVYNFVCATNTSQTLAGVCSAITGAWCVRLA